METIVPDLCAEIGRHGLVGDYGEDIEVVAADRISTWSYPRFGLNASRGSHG